MNDQHAHAGYAAYDGYQNGTFEADPLFGSLPGGQEAATSHGEYAPQYAATPQWDSGAYETGGYDTYATTASPATPQYEATAQWDATAWNQADPLTGPLNGSEQTGQFDAAPFGYDASGQVITAPFDPAQAAQFEAAQFEAAQFDAAQFETAGFESAGFETAGFDGNTFESAQFEKAQPGTDQFPAAPLGYEATQQWMAPTFGTGTYDTTAWNSATATADQAGGAAESSDPYQDSLGTEAVAPEQYHPGYEGQEPYGQGEFDTPPGGFDASGTETGASAGAGSGTGAGPDTGAGSPADGGGENPAGAETDGGRSDADLDPDSVHMAPTMTVPAITVEPRAARRAGSGGSRGRRRTPAKRSALLTVAVPSACVMGVAGIAAASVSGISGEEGQDETTTTASAEDTAAVQTAAASQANNKLDTQLEALSAEARDFGDRASRTQERIDLKERQDAEKKRRAEEAARKEALRPKFALPVTQQGLSAQYGQAGVNWMSMHTGIDFPVSYGTPVMAATDGTVRTQYNSAYGNMAIVTAPDGTETWYCHLSSTKIRSGSVKAGEVIAYSGNSGNSTGPHLHFEVRPGGGAAIDPLAWLQSHGLNPL
ncbi:M23 family metallopeptidase [Streptomyces sp. NRRL F-5135]|uniref:M23 family metallopeptidase n=1 Tax=Streptomyces sp. NRRL F-5135 TaxID=1463858 RepID=UPI0004C4E38F|nr:M23 family metallopeptidase [Streptomyces sp. NRRL F-5135]